jgi:hypothetical protein
MSYMSVNDAFVFCIRESKMTAWCGRLLPVLRNRPSGKEFILLHMIGAILQHILFETSGKDLFQWKYIDRLHFETS